MKPRRRFKQRFTRDLVMVSLPGNAASVEPGFLTDGNRGYYCIRSGPSSVEPPVREILNVIRCRK